jgi:hypothetical protein
MSPIADSGNQIKMDRGSEDRGTMYETNLNGGVRKAEIGRRRRRADAAMDQDC